MVFPRISPESFATTPEIQSFSLVEQGVGRLAVFRDISASNERILNFIAMKMHRLIRYHGGWGVVGGSAIV